MSRKSTRMSTTSTLVNGLTKRHIRSKILLRLRTQKEEDRNKKSRLIKEKLFKSGVFKKAKKVMFYLAFDGEVDTREMIKEALKLGKTVAVPVCRAGRVIKPCLLATKARLKKGRYGIYEPAVKEFIDPKELDLVIVPAVAFDKRLRRLGRGKGYYDVFLSKLAKGTPSLGLAFDFQVLPTLPVNAHDVNVQKILFA